MTATLKAQVLLPISNELARDYGQFEGDEEEFMRFAKPYRNGILSEARVGRASRARLVKDSHALRAALRRATEELADLKAHTEGRKRRFESFVLTTWPAESGPKDA